MTALPEGPHSYLDAGGFLLADVVLIARSDHPGLYVLTALIGDGDGWRRLRWTVDEATARVMAAGPGWTPVARWVEHHLDEGEEDR